MVSVPKTTNQIKGNTVMKKSLFAVGGAFAAALLLSGCAGVTTNNGGVAPISAGPNFFSEVSANAMLQPTCAKDAVIVKRDVTATATMESYFTCVNMGDISYETLKKAALKQAPGATDLIDVKMDYSMKNICGINKVTVKMTATAIKFSK